MEQAALNAYLSNLLIDRYCTSTAAEWAACLAAVPPTASLDGSFVDRSIQRKELLKCEPYKAVAAACMEDERRQQAILREAASAPACEDERAALGACHRRHNADAETCDAAVLQLLACGLPRLHADVSTSLPIPYVQYRDFALLFCNPHGGMPS
jgi:hypothetical protein